MRNYEPRLALVPAALHSKTDTEVGDAFYPQLLHIASELGVRVFVVEVADLAQAQRVVRMVLESRGWEGCEIWRDFPGQGGYYGKEGVVDGEVVDVDGRGVRVKGEGEGRGVVAWREGWGKLFAE